MQKNKPKTLLINPAYYLSIYTNSKIKAGLGQATPTLSFACIAAPLLEKQFPVKFIDLNIASDPSALLQETVSLYKPDIVGISATTATFYLAYEIAAQVKAISPATIVVLGGPHASALPEEVLSHKEIDCVVVGEGDFSLLQIAKEGLHDLIPNVIFRSNEKIVYSRELNFSIKNLDDLPFPAYELFNIPQYTQPKLNSRKSPVGHMETSRGCYAKCVYCNKNVHGFKFRTKTSKRVVDEMEHMLKLGFREIHIYDDVFTADMSRVHRICDEIINRKLVFPWFPRGGIRVDCVDESLLRKMKAAGCYRLPFGVESGSQRILDVIKKNITVEQVIEAVRLAKKIGLETECYFMIGLPSETVEDINKSIALAIKLNPDYCKFAKTIPLPGTPMFDQMEKEGRIKTRDWRYYNYSSQICKLYDHDTLTSEDIEKYHNLAHLKFYFRPKYVFLMIIKTIRKRTFWAHVSSFIKTNWLSVFVLSSVLRVFVQI